MRRSVYRRIVSVFLTLLGASLAVFALAELGLGSKLLSHWRAAYAGPGTPPSAATRPQFVRPAELKVKQWVFDGGRKVEWQDWGWATRADVPDGPARLKMSDWGGWRLVRLGLTGSFGGLTFRFKAPASYGQFLTVQLAHPDQHDFPRIVIEKGYVKALPDGVLEVFVPMLHLNPDGQPFEQLVFAPLTALPEGWVEIDKIGLTEGSAQKMPAAAPKSAQMSVSCGGQKTPINPLIYGIGMGHDVPKDEHHWLMSATIRRWGGNPTSRYNWKLGNAWNTASDWYFENVDYVGAPGYSYATFIQNNKQRGMKTALTVPMIGWVAKDTRSVSFPRAKFAVQDAFDAERPEAGNGRRDNKPIAPLPPSTTSVPAPPAFIKEWIETIVRADQAGGGRSVQQYILDNEPALWNSTHRDVHPEPLTYDELLEKTIAYGTAIREADPQAVIAGPAEWGWMGYLYSAKDMDDGQLVKKADRLAHGNVPLIEWYLRKLAEHEKRTGVRILDVVDLHYYPQDIDFNATDDKSAEKRLRATRSLWDSSYTDESWIDDTVRLLPRMKEWIAKNYPGRGISIGEWNFGGEKHISGALATAETLGRFAQAGISSAFYWSIPPANSATFWGFRAFRNFDGKGAAFESFSIPAHASDGVSLFASRDTSGRRYVMVALNLDRKSARHAEISLRGCVPFTKIAAYSYAGGPKGFSSHKVESTPGELVVDLAPWSITVIEGSVEPIGSDRAEVEPRRK